MPPKSKKEKQKQKRSPNCQICSTKFTLFVFRYRCTTCDKNICVNCSGKAKGNSNRQCTGCAPDVAPQGAAKVDLPKGPRPPAGPPPKGTTQEWSCETCVFVNEPTAVFCFACNAPKPAAAKQVKRWICRRCAYRNLMDKARCEMCGARSPQPVVRPCHTCNQMKPLMRCGRCKKTLYCSKPCQVEDWPIHRKGCKKPEPKPEPPAGAPGDMKTATMNRPQQKHMTKKAAELAAALEQEKKRLADEAAAKSAADAADAAAKAAAEQAAKELASAQANKASADAAVAAIEAEEKEELAKAVADAPVEAPNAQEANMADEEETPWVCEICTYENRGGRDSCALCLSARPEEDASVYNYTHWACPVCTHNNMQLVANCELCMATKPRGEDLIKSQEAAKESDELAKITIEERVQESQEAEKEIKKATMNLKGKLDFSYKTDEAEVQAAAGEVKTATTQPAYKFKSGAQTLSRSQAKQIAKKAKESGGTMKKPRQLTMKSEWLTAELKAEEMYRDWEKTKTDTAAAEAKAAEAKSASVEMQAQLDAAKAQEAAGVDTSVAGQSAAEDEEDEAGAAAAEAAAAGVIPGGYDTSARPDPHSGLKSELYELLNGDKERLNAFLRRSAQYGEGKINASMYYYVIGKTFGDALVPMVVPKLLAALEDSVHRNALRSIHVSTMARKCGQCGKIVYLPEQITAGGRVWHKDTCFKCTDPSCQVTLTQNSYVLQGRTLFCKKHVPRSP